LRATARLWPSTARERHCRGYWTPRQADAIRRWGTNWGIRAWNAIETVPEYTGTTRPLAVAADAAPDDIEAAFAAADAEILQQNVAGAFDRLIALIKRTAGDERTKVRTRLIELFDLFDPADPEVIAGRRKLANALY
jgi:thioredoxin-like negative regulator of GroEL